MDNLGGRLRSLRRERSLTLAELGKQVGLSASYLSQIERGAILPSLPRLSTIAKALAVDVRDFFEEEGAPSCVVRRDHGKRLRDDDGVLVELLSADPLGKYILPYRVVCQPGTCCQRPAAYPGEECAFVVKGQLSVAVGDETIVLTAGDSIHYQRHQPVAWRNEGDGECIVVWAASPPINEDDLEG